MNQIMTRSEPTETTTTGQIVKNVANYKAMLTRHATNFQAEVVQLVLGMPELAKKQFELFRELVEAHSKTITRRAVVNRNRALYEAVAATDRKPHLNEFLIKTMPTPTGDIEAIFIKLGRNVDCNTLDDELAAVGLELIVDPQGLAAINEDDPAFADDHPNGTQWKDTEGRYCFMSFYRGGSQRRVRVGQDDRPWRDLWWFPCRRLYS